MRAWEEAKRLVTRTAGQPVAAGGHGCRSSIGSESGMPRLLCCLLQVNADQKWLVEAASSAGQTWIHREYAIPSVKYLKDLLMK